MITWAGYEWGDSVLYGRCDWAPDLWDNEALVALVQKFNPGFQPGCNECPDIPAYTAPCTVTSESRGSSCL